MHKDADNSFIFSEEEIEAKRKSHNITPIKPIKQIEPLTMEMIQLENPPPKQYALYPILPVQGIALVFAAAGVGKTMFTLNLAYAIAGGGNFLGYTAPKPRKILYIDAEMAYVDIHSRLMQISVQQGKLDIPGNFFIYTPDRMMAKDETIPIRMPKICSPEGQAFYSDVIERHNIDVIVFDNLSMLTTVNLDTGEDLHLFTDWQLHLRARGKTMINVHHAGKDKNGYRGSSKLIDHVDTAISLQAIDDSLPENADDSLMGKRFKVVYQKNRSFFGKESLPFEVTFHNEKWSCRTMEKSEMERVVEMVKLGMNQVSISKELGCGQSKIAKLIKKARGFKLID
jgi:hypothetical protein